ncbi:glycosyltransferase [Planktomarina temperata]|nr:glycosyltransferase [Planktomarina temperata]
MKTRLNILIVAYACSPYQGSEPGVGWGFVNELSKHHNLWVIVEEDKFRSDIEKYCEYTPLNSNVNFVFIKKKRAKLLRKLWPPSYYLFYRAWHRKAFHAANILHKQHHFDLVHQLTMVGYREPGYLYEMKIPFVWGPIGGLGFFPKRFLSVLGFRMGVYYCAYNLVNWLQMHFGIRVHKALDWISKNGALIAATSENLNSVKRMRPDIDGIVLSEVGVDKLKNAEPNYRNPGDTLHIVWSGLNIPRKGLYLALMALTQIPGDINYHLHIQGDGPLRPEMQSLAKRLGLGRKVTFYGWVERSVARAIMRRSHLMLITSLRDLTSTVTIEALSNALPVICLDHCGFSDVIDHTCGIKIKVTKPAHVISRISREICFLEKNEIVRQRLSEGALAKSTDFIWENKVKTVLKVYDQVVENSKKSL